MTHYREALVAAVLACAVLSITPSAAVVYMPGDGPAQTKQLSPDEMKSAMSSPKTAPEVGHGEAVRPMPSPVETAPAPSGDPQAVLAVTGRTPLKDAARPDAPAQETDGRNVRTQVTITLAVLGLVLGGIVGILRKAERQAAMTVGDDV